VVKLDKGNAARFWGGVFFGKKRKKYFEILLTFQKYCAILLTVRRNDSRQGVEI